MLKFIAIFCFFANIIECEYLRNGSTRWRLNFLCIPNVVEQLIRTFQEMSNQTDPAKVAILDDFKFFNIASISAGEYYNFGSHGKHHHWFVPPRAYQLNNWSFQHSRAIYEIHVNVSFLSHWFYRGLDNFVKSRRSRTFYRQTFMPYFLKIG